MVHIFSLSWRGEFFEERNCSARAHWPPYWRAEKHKLFSQEEGKAGQVFVFSATCLHNDPSVLDEAALITAVARFTRQLGRSSRRGLAECKGSRSKDHTCEKFLLEHFKRGLVGETKVHACLHNRKKYISEIDYARFFHEKKLRFRLIIRLDEPLLIANRAMAGNWFSPIHLYLGSTIRGALGLLLPLQDATWLIKKNLPWFCWVILSRRHYFSIYTPTYLGGKKFIYPTIPFSSRINHMYCGAFQWKCGTRHLKAWETNKCRHCKQERMGNNQRLSAFKKNRWFFLYTFVKAISGNACSNSWEKLSEHRGADLYGYNVLDAGAVFFEANYIVPMNLLGKRFQEMTGILEQKLQILRLGKARQRGYGKVSAWFERLEEFPDSCVQLPLHKLNEKGTHLYYLIDWHHNCQSMGTTSRWILRRLVDSGN